MKTRRTMLLGLAGSSLVTPVALAKEVCEVTANGRRCVAGVEIGSIQTARQRCDNWCWAACVQTIFNVNGYDVDQQILVERVFGDPTLCAPANMLQTMYALEGLWTDRRGRQFRATSYIVSQGALAMRGVTPAYGTVLSASRIVNHLKDGQMLIVGTLVGSAQVGHAVALTAVEYEERTYVQYGVLKTDHFITNMIVRDPAVSAQNRRSLTDTERAGGMLVIGVRVEPA
jgi:hypothetical protein